MSKLTVKGYVIVEDKDLPIIESLLDEHIVLTQAEPGCISFIVEKNPDNPNRFDVFEEFESREAFNQHQMRVKQSEWGQLNLDLERHYQVLE